MADFTADVAQLENLKADLKALGTQADGIASNVNSVSHHLGGIRSLANKGYPAKISAVGGAISKAAGGTKTASARLEKIAESYRRCETDVRRSVSEVSKAISNGMPVSILGASFVASNSVATDEDLIPVFRDAAASGLLAKAMLESDDTELSESVQRVLDEERNDVNRVLEKKEAKSSLTWKQRLSKYLNDPKTLKKVDRINEAGNNFLDGPIKTVSSWIGKVKIMGIQLPDFYALSEQAERRRESYLAKIDSMKRNGSSKSELYSYVIESIVGETAQIIDDTGLVKIIKKYASL